MPQIDDAGPDALVRRLHDDHAAALLGWARGRMADERDAEEVVAEALVSAWRHYDQFDEHRGSERSWLFGIARNAAVDLHRRNGTRILHLVEDSDLDVVLEDTDLELVTETSVLRDALLELSESHRTVIFAAYFGGMSTREIATAVGIPEGTVKSRIYYGMRALRSALEERGVLR